MDFQSWLTKKLPGVSLHSAQSVLKLTEEGGTIPFIARYRKEATGNLDEVMVKRVIELKEELDAVIKRQAHILGEIENQKKLTPELKALISKSFDLDQLEEIYLPYKQKRKTKATMAKEAGLEPLALWVWNTAQGLEQPLEPLGQISLEEKAKAFLNPEHEITDVKTVLEKTLDILIEMISMKTELREFVHTSVFNEGHIKTSKSKKAQAHSKFERYFDYCESIHCCPVRSGELKN